MGRCHLAALDGVAEIDVVALAEPSTPAREAAAARRPGARTYAAAAEALTHPGLEAGIVVTPTPSHPVMVEAALDAGLHVLCEKPLALDVAEGDRLGSLAERRGRVLQIGFWRRFAAPWRAAKD